MKEDKQKLVFISILVLVVLVGVVLFLFNNKKGKGTINSVRDIKSMIKTIYKQVYLPELATSVINVKNEDEVTTYTGLQSNKDVESLVVSIPTMTSQAYLLSVVKVKDGANVEKMKQEMLDNIDMDMWICVSADKLYITNSGNVIFLVMTNEEWATSVYNNFKKYVNNNIGKELTKSNNIELPDELLAN